MLSTVASSSTPEPRDEVVCPLCGKRSDNQVMIARDRLFAQPGEYPVVRCETCGIQFLRSRPTLEALGVHYPLAYFPYKKVEDEPKFLQPIARMFEDAHWSGMVKRIERGTGPISANAQVLDVGCGLNHLLALVRRTRGCVGTGVEFNPDVAAYVRETLGMPVVAGTLHDGKFEDGRFDIVTMNGYLEHEPFPRDVLEETRRITKAGGFISISVPQADSLPARIFGSCWAQVDAPRHLFHWTPKSLGNLLAATGFEVTRVENYGVPLAIGLSVLQSMGRRRMGKMGLFDSLFASIFSIPFIPIAPWVGEFMAVTARAIPR